MIPLNEPIMTSEMKKAALDVLSSEKLVLGESVFKFEENFAKYIGVDHAVSCSSGTMALWLILQSMPQVKKIVIPANTFHTMASVAKLQNIEIEFCDVAFDACMPKRKTKPNEYLLATHLYGNYCSAAKCERVIEDCSQAAGLSHSGRRAGSFGEAGFFSLYTTKNLTCGGDGGIITTNNAEIADKCRSLANCGRMPGKDSNEHLVAGITSRLNTVNAAIANIQLKYLDNWNLHRMFVRSWYAENLRTLRPTFHPSIISDGVCHQMVMYVNGSRDELRQFLRKNNVETGIHYPVPLHKQVPFYQPNLELPIAEELSEHIVSLPISPRLSKRKVKHVCNLIAKWRSEYD